MRLFLLLSLLSSSVAWAQAVPSVSAERLKRVDKILQKYVDDGQVAGVVALVLQDGKPVYEHAAGWSDKEGGRKMTADTIFRIASQTKAITTTAVLALMEEGKIGITEPVSHFIPTFAKTTVAVKSDSGVNLVPAKRPITIQDLLTHTAGISYGTELPGGIALRSEGPGPGGGQRLVHRRQERADL